MTRATVGSAAKPAADWGNAVKGCETSSTGTFVKPSQGAWRTA
jgi:hypothetical protein